jgi:tetratricopeptide (TPR) repeat protein
MPVAPRSLKELFLAALAVAPADRDGWLDRECGPDVELRRRVELMLAAHDTPQSLLDRLAPAAGPPEVAIGDFAAGGADSPSGAESEAVGAVIAGRYKLVEEIGAGGMGTVWMAQQTEPIKRLVAIKLIRPGMDSKQVLARFEAERQALALMDHLHIARVLDAGTTAAGRPYFVMELVKGQPITKYCDEQRLAVRERLELFGDVCRAVQHAHQKGIIHRDLKPSNVLAAPYDGKPVVKVIDFGVAKATGQRLTDKTLFTGFGALVGTPEYMSPEQAEVNNQDIDTRSDIYSLGVLLYELLTGSTPLTRKRLKEAPILEVLRVIREEEPPRPSTRLAESRDTLPSISAQRQTEPAKLTKLVRGELDWIVMKALEKDRNRRYETAGAFAEDVQRYLRDEAVQACPPSAWYRVRKFAWRNKGPVLATSVILLCLIGGIIGTSWGMMQAIAAQDTIRAEAREKDRAKKAAEHQALIANSVSESLKQMLGALDPDAAKGPLYPARQLLDDYADNLEAKLGDLPEAAADLHAIIGRAYACLGARAKARKHLGRALLLRRQVFGNQHEKYADILVAHARPDVAGPNNRTQSEADLRQALAIYRQRGVGGEPVIGALWVLRWLYVEWAHDGQPGKWDGLEPVAQEALAEARKFPGQDFPKLASILGGWASAKITHGQYAEGEGIAREALARHRKLHGPEHLETAWGYFVLAKALRLQNKLPEALQADKQALAIIRKRLPAEHRNTAVALDGVNRTLDAAGKAQHWRELFPSVAALNEWEAVFREVLATAKPVKRTGGDPRLSALDGLARCSTIYLHLGDDWAAAGKSGEAEEARQKAVKLSFFLAMAHWRIGHKDEARSWYEKGVQWMDRAEPQNDELRRFRAEAEELLGIAKQK